MSDKIIPYIVVAIVCLAALVGCTDYTDYKDFDLSKTCFHIDTLNSGELILTEHYSWDESRDRYVVHDRNGDRVVSADTCYLKYRAYNFWMNEVKK